MKGGVNDHQMVNNYVARAKATADKETVRQEKARAVAEDVRLRAIRERITPHEAMMNMQAEADVEAEAEKVILRREGQAKIDEDLDRHFQERKVKIDSPKKFGENDDLYPLPGGQQ